MHPSLSKDGGHVRLLSIPPSTFAAEDPSASVLEGNDVNQTAPSLGFYGTGVRVNGELQNVTIILDHHERGNSIASQSISMGDQPWGYHVLGMRFYPMKPTFYFTSPMKPTQVFNFTMTLGMETQA